MAVTETRNFPGLVFNWKWFQGGFNTGTYQDTGIDVFQTGDQTTTSYRTGRRAQTDIGPGAFVSTSGSQIDFARMLRDESKGDLGRSLPDNGHEFSSSYTRHLWPQPTGCSTNGPHGAIRGQDVYILPILSPTLPPMTYPSPTQKVIDGTKLISMTIPTAPEANLAQFLGELRERLPQFVGTALYHKGLSPSSIGEEHLNVQFGIKPFWNDCQKMAQSVLNAGAILRQYRRDSDRYVRRRASLGGNSSSVQRANVTSGLAMPAFYGIGLQGDFYSNNPPTTVIDNYHSEAWFSGAWQYHLQDADSFLDRLYYYEQLANHLLGTRFTASTFWELTPWSWLVDWNFDIGRFFKNVDALSSDSLVLRYGYVMHRTECTRIYAKNGLVLQPGASAPISSQSYHTVSRKERLRATPYGFGIDMQALSPARIAILAALGLTKAPGGNLKFLN